MDGAPWIDDTASACIARWGELKTLRAPYDLEREELTRLFKPFGAGHIADGRLSDHPNYATPINSFPVVARVNAAAGIYGTLTNPANTWVRLKLADPDLANSHAAQIWQDVVSTRVLQSFGEGVSRFYDEAITFYGDVVTFGNACMYDEIDVARGRILDRTIPLGQVCVDYNHHGDLIEVIRCFEMTARAAARMFGADRLTPKLRDLADKGDVAKHNFYHWVMPNDSYAPGKLGVAGKKFVSVYCSETGKAVISTSGYYDMPYDYAGWEQDAGQAYSRGMGHVALASARKLMVHEANNMRAGALAGNPPMGMADVRQMRRQGAITPGAVLMGAVSQSGQRLIQPLLGYTGVPITVEMTDRAIEECKDALNWSLMMLAGRSGMTATEVIERSEEKLRLMAPHLGRIQTQFLAPKIQRRFWRLWRAGQLPPPPPEAEGVALQVEYLSAAALAQKSADGAATRRFIDDVMVLAQGNPEVLDEVDPAGYVQVMHAARGAPAMVRRSREQIEEVRASRAQAAQMAQLQQMAQVAQTGAGAVRDLAQAGAGGQP